MLEGPKKTGNRSENIHRQLARCCGDNLERGGRENYTSKEEKRADPKEGKSAETERGVNN